MPDRQPYDLRRLLPVSATKVERDLISLAPSDADVLARIHGISGVKTTNIPVSFLPWLLAEYGGAWIQQWIQDPVAALAAAKRIRQLKGTAAGIKEAFSWLGFDKDEMRVIEATYPGLHFAEYGVDPGEIIFDMSLIPALHSIAQEIHPVRSRFRRLVHGYDIGVFILNESHFSRELLQHPSGVWFDSLGLGYKPTELQVSFGSFSRTYAESAERDDPISTYTKTNIWTALRSEGNALPILGEDFVLGGGMLTFNQNNLWPLTYRRREITHVLQPVANWDMLMWGDDTWEGATPTYGHTSVEVVENAIVDEDGNNLVTEDGDFIVYE